MTATTLRKSFFGTRFRSKVAENKKLLIVNLVFELLGLPMICITLLYDAYMADKNFDYYSADMDDYVGIWFTAVAISIAMGALIALFNFNYLYKKSLVDMNLSLPLSSKERFFADYLSGAFIYFAPVIVAVVLSYIILGIGNLCINIDALELSMGFGELVWQVTKVGIAVLVTMLLYYTISVFSIMFCGSSFEAASSIGLVNAMIPATVSCIWASIIDINSNGFGLTSEEIFYNPIFTSTSPVGCVAFIIQHFENIVYSYSSDYVGSSYSRWMIATLIFIAFLVFVSFVLYKIRKAEDVSKPYIFKGYYYTLMSMAVFCVMSLMSLDSDNIIIGIFICAIFWFIMEVITRRGFKRFWVGGLVFAGSLAIFFVFSSLCTSTDGFGITKYVPSTLNIESANYTINGSTVSTSVIKNKFKIKDREVIKDLTDLNKELIDRKYNSQNYSYNTFERKYNLTDSYAQDYAYITITYYTRTGSCIIRSYDNIPTAMVAKLLEDSMLTDEYAEAAADALAYTSYQNYHVNHDNDTGWHTEAAAYEKANSKASLVIYDRVMGSEKSFVLSSAEMKELKKAYADDLKAMTKEQLEAKKEVAYLSGSALFVLDSFDNTLSFLNKKDIDIVEIDEDYLDENSGINFKAFNEPKYYANMINDEEAHFDDYEIVISVENITSNYEFNYRNENIYTPSLYSFRYCDSDVICNVLENSTLLMFNEKPIAEIQIGTNMFYLPDSEENRELLKEVNKMFSDEIQTDTTKRSKIKKDIE